MIKITRGNSSVKDFWKINDRNFPLIINGLCKNWSIYKMTLEELIVDTGDVFFKVGGRSCDEGEILATLGQYVQYSETTNDIDKFDIFDGTFEYNTMIDKKYR